MKNKILLYDVTYNKFFFFRYRDAGIEVAKVLQKFTTLLERASIDEAYLDITIPVSYEFINNFSFICVLLMVYKLRIK